MRLQVEKQLEEEKNRAVALEAAAQTERRFREQESLASARLRAEARALEEKQAAQREAHEREILRLGTEAAKARAVEEKRAAAEAEAARA